VHQVAELVTEVIPGCSLAELTALEVILASLAQQGSLSAPTLVHLLFQDMCHYFTKLQQHQQAERERRQQQRAEPATAMDVDADAGVSAAAGADVAVEMTRADIVDGLRHVFTLLSMLSAAQPDAIKAKYVPVLLEVAFSADLAVSHVLNISIRGPIYRMQWGGAWPKVRSQACPQAHADGSGLLSCHPR
jgi:hypothetical protein